MEGVLLNPLIRKECENLLYQLLEKSSTSKKLAHELEQNIYQWSQNVLKTQTYEEYQTEINKPIDQKQQQQEESQQEQQEQQESASEDEVEVKEPKKKKRKKRIKKPIIYYNKYILTHQFQPTPNDLYERKMKQILSCIRQHSSVFTCSFFSSGHIPCSLFVSLEDQDMMAFFQTNKVDSITDSSNYINEIVSQYEQTCKDTINQYSLTKTECMKRCKKCHSKDVEFINQVQTRGADEPMTNFYKCNSCGQILKD